MSRDPLFLAVIAAPSDMAPRRAYADAVRAKDPDRAALIDHQLATREALRRGDEPDPAHEDAAERLIRKSGKLWCGPIAGAVQAYAYWGGFVEEARVVGERFTAHSAKLRAFAPIRMLVVDKLAGFAGDVLADPLLGQLVALDIGENQLADDDIIRFATAPALRGLQVLRIAGNRCGLRALRALAGLPALRFVDADNTEAPLRAYLSDAADAIVHAPARDVLRAELGDRPWLDALERPRNDAL